MKGTPAVAEGKADLAVGLTGNARATALLDVWRPPRDEGLDQPGGKELKTRGLTRNDTLEQMRAKHKRSHTQGLDLACSACKWAAQRLLFQLSRKIKGSKDKKVRREGALEVIKSGPCRGKPNWPERFGIVGKDGDREFVDELVALKEGHNRAQESGIRKDHGGEALVKTILYCEQLTLGFQDEIVEMCVKTPERVGQVNWEKFLCFEQFARGSLCSEKQVTVEEEDEDEDDDEEL